MGCATAIPTILLGCACSVYSENWSKDKLQDEKTEAMVDVPVPGVSYLFLTFARQVSQPISVRLTARCRKTADHLSLHAIGVSQRNSL
jgi:hypothetical protein